RSGIEERGQRELGQELAPEWDAAAVEGQLLVPAGARRAGRAEVDVLIADLDSAAGSCRLAAGLYRRPQLRADERVSAQHDRAQLLLRPAPAAASCGTIARIREQREAEPRPRCRLRPRPGVERRSRGKDRGR